jgi:Reverse transcriptase (RNA-dependent DNA polymerase)
MFVVRDAALGWFRSYLCGRLQFVRCCGSTFGPTDVVCGVPKGSVLGPILFIVYTIDLQDIVAAHRLLCHLYADDSQSISQIYGSCRSDSTAALSAAVSDCSTAIAN